MIEIIATNPEEAKIIEKCCADRIELVSGFSEGGLTPSYGIIEKTIKATTIPINVMIRPHAKSFVYTKDDIETMKIDIKIAKKLGANGVVFGVLNNNNEINEKQLVELIEVSGDLDITFHKAIDELDDIPKGIQILSKYQQITTILTSGGKGDITRNIPLIKKIKIESNHLKIMIGGGLNFNNIEKIIKESKADDYHFGTAVRFQNSHFKNIDENKLAKLINFIK